MEVKFENRELSCLDIALHEVSGSEQTQEIKLPDGMPDVGHVICAWGQPIVRSKEWRADSVAFSGGMMVWVLYRSEDGTGDRCIDAWVPFQVKWDLPAGTPEGTIRIRCVPRFVDARSVSPRKIMVRAGMGVMVSAVVPKTFGLCRSDQKIPGMELLQVTYPVRLLQEAGEKSFLLEDTLRLPESVPGARKLICYRIESKITDKKVLTEKLVFRGNALLHVLYASEDGRLWSWDFEVPFSQYTELDREHGSDAQAEFVMGTTSLELELADDGSFVLKSGIVVQYLIVDKVMITVTEDAYCPGRQTCLHTRILELPVVLENRREMASGETGLGTDGASLTDLTFLPDFPRLMGTENGVLLETAGQVQGLYYDEEECLRNASGRWTAQINLPSDEQTELFVYPGVPQLQTNPGMQGIQIKAELPLEITAMARQGIMMVTGVETGEATLPDPARPSLILRRCGTKRLWDIARDSGSTVEAIRQANGLQGEPEPGQMLLIPVP